MWNAFAATEGFGDTHTVGNTREALERIGKHYGDHSSRTGRTWRTLWRTVLLHGKVSGNTTLENTVSSLRRETPRNQQYFWSCISRLADKKSGMSPGNTHLLGPFLQSRLCDSEHAFGCWRVRFSRMIGEPMLQRQGEGSNGGREGKGGGRRVLEG